MSDGRGWQWALVALTFTYLIALTAGCFPVHAEPRAALPYRSSLIRETRAVWGLQSPVAVIAGQIEQESAWNPRACSPYACGLAQFTPATAQDMAARHKTLPATDVFNPAWALRAAVLYDRDLYLQLAAATECDRWGFTLSAYNGGLGNVRRDTALCTRATGCRTDRWFGHVDRRSARAAEAFRENRAYPQRILYERQHAYAGWGATVPCPSSV